MNKRTFGRLNWSVTEVGYGMWGMGGWTDSDDAESLAALDRAVELGCNFFDTAWVYGNGRSEKLMGETLRRHPGQRLYVASKVPPKNMKWPGSSTDPASETYPAAHIREYTERSIENLGVMRLDLQQLHVWSDAWANDEGWQRAAADLKSEGLIEGFGISVNRWQPANVLKAIETGLVDSVQVVYNIFDQAPEDELFPACERLNVAVIARVPFDEGSLTGKLTRDSTWPDGDFRNMYFTRENLATTLDHVDWLLPLVPEGMDLAVLALRFILAQPAVSTVIPGMRKTRHVERNLAAADGRGLDPAVFEALRAHRWDSVYCDSLGTGTASAAP